MLMEVARILWLRRLRVGLAVFAGLLAGAGTFMMIPPRQQSTAQVLFVPSAKQPGVDGPTNPFLSLGGSVAVVASLIQIQVSDEQTINALAQSGQTAKYQVVPNLTENAGPVLIITTDDVSAATAQSTLKAVIAVIQQDLRRAQVDQRVPEDLMVTSVVLTTSAKALIVRKAQVQDTVVAFIAVLVLLICVILLAERRRRAKSRGVGRRGNAGVKEYEPPTAASASGDGSSRRESSADSPEGGDSAKKRNRNGMTSGVRG